MAERKDTERNDAGFSLVEILVAVVVLAIIVVPLLHSFASAARTNAKAREISQATTAGTNVMEEIKYVPIETLLADTSKVTKQEFTGISSGHKSYVYNYHYGDITVDGTTYDANVTLDPVEYTPGIDSIPEITEYNGKELTGLYDMNGVQDACYIQDTDLDERMAKLFVGYGTSDVKKGMHRNLIVDISGTAAKQTVDVTMEYRFSGAVKYAEPQKQCIYSNSRADVNLRNVYLFFQPMYNGTALDIKEQITIRNLSGLPVNVYLIRQEQNRTETDAERLAREAAYRIDVNVLEKDRAAASYFNADGELVVLTGIRSNLSDVGNSAAVPVQYQQVNLKYGVTDGDYTESRNILLNGVIQVKTAAQLLDFTDLSAPQAKEQVYRIKVNIYRKGERANGKTALVSLEGAKEE